MKHLDINPKQGLFLILFLLLAAYSLFQARFIILGPSIRVTYPMDGARVEAPVYTLTGVAKNVAYISLNDRPIYLSEKGEFNEKLIAPSGLSIITIRARDRFGRQTEKSIRVVYNN